MYKEETCWKPIIYYVEPTPERINPYPKNRNLYDNQTFQKAILLNIDENIRNYNTLLPFDLQNTSYNMCLVRDTDVYTYLWNFLLNFKQNI